MIGKSINIDFQVKTTILTKILTEVQNLNCDFCRLNLVYEIYEIKGTA